MKRPNDPKRRQNPSTPGSRDLDLTAALKARPTPAVAAAPQSNSVSRRPGIRTGGRIRMDTPKSTRPGPRRRPILEPRYKKNGRAINWRGILGGGLAAGLIIGSTVYAFTTPKLAIRSVDIDGVPPAEAAQLRSEIPVDPHGRNVLLYWLIRGSSIRQMMATARPDFASAGVGIRFPHTLTVHIVDRTPFALLAAGENGEGGVWVLDSRGVPIFDVSGPMSRPAGLPKIEIDSAQSVSLGQQLPGQMAAQVASAYNLLQTLKSVPELGTVGSIRVDKMSNLGLNMTNHLSIRLGQPTGLADKLTLVAGLLSQRPDIAAQAAYLDVSYPARPAMMPKNAQPIDATKIASK